MFEDHRRLIIIALAVIIIVVIGVVLWLIFGPKSTSQNQQAGTTPKVETTGALDLGLPATPPERLAQEAKYPIGLKQLAMAFAERYGSYSTDEPKKNLNDLQSQMTKVFYQTELAKPLAIGDSGFSGFSVKALAADLSSVKTDSATVLVKTQVAQTNGSNATPNVYYRNLQLDFVKSGSDWLVNSATWQ